MRARLLVTLAVPILLAISASAWSQPAGPLVEVRPVTTALNSEIPITGDMFRILRPNNGSVVDLDVQQAILLLWNPEGPLDERTVRFETSVGELSSEEVDIDDSGFAVVYLKSSVPGNALVKANSTGTRTDEIEITFRAREPADDTYHSGGQDIPLEIYTDRIGFQAKTGAPAARVLEIAATENLALVQTFYRDIYEFELDEDYSRDTLNMFARRLETAYPNEIRMAGLVVKTTTSTTPMLMTGDILIGFETTPSPQQLKSIKTQFHLATIEPLDGCSTIYVATVLPEWQWNILAIANAILGTASPKATFAHPNFVVHIKNHANGSETSDISCSGFLPNPGSKDPRYCQQWHHDNRALGGGVLDADIDTAIAWDMSTGGTRNPLLAIIDSGFSITHGDLAGNLWTHATDGSKGRDFDDDDHVSLLDNPINPNPHGTSVAGIVGGIAHNTNNGRGVCPACKLLLIRHGADNASATRSICFAISQNSDAISNSWGADAVFDSVKQAIKEAAEDNDIPVLFATASVEQQDHCNDGIDLSSIDKHVIAVSSVTHVDDRTESGFGDCVDVLAPSRRGGDNGITTTSVSHDPDATAAPFFYNTHTLNFGGTSAATPMVTGTIGLMVDANPDLSRIDIQRVLQDTADKVDPDEGYYDPDSGFSNPDASTATHAYGRINAFEAVSLVAPFDPTESNILKRGHGGKDLILRDHALDWGNTERPSNEKFTPTAPREDASIERSVDIKFDVFPFETANITTAEFAGLESEEPKAGHRSRVYVRVRNRGPATVASAILKLHWTLEQPIPSLQADFWSNFPNDPSGPFDPQVWVPLPSQTLTGVEYSGPSAAGCPGRAVPACLPIGNAPTDAARIAVFDIPAMNWNQSAGEKLSLLAVAHSGEDPALAKLVATPPGNLLDVATAVAWDNNVSLWVAEENACEVWILILIAVIIIAVIILIAYIIWLWRNGRPVRVVIYVTLTILLIVFYYLWIRLPWCFVLPINI